MNHKECSSTLNLPKEAWGLRLTPCHCPGAGVPRLLCEMPRHRRGWIEHTKPSSSGAN